MLLGVEACLMMLDRLEQVTMRVGVNAIVRPASTHVLVLAVVIATTALISLILVGTPVIKLLVSLLTVAVEALIMIMLLTFIPTMVPFLEPVTRIMICLRAGWS